MTLDYQNWVSKIFQSFLFEIPTFVLAITGLIVALALWRRHPRISLYVIGSMLVMIILKTSSVLFFSWLFLQLGNGETITYHNYELIYRTAFLIFQLLGLIPLILLLMAVFGDRKPLSEK